MKNQTKRQVLQAQRRRKKLIRNSVIAGTGLVVLALVIFLLLNAFRPAVGEAIPVMADFSHVPEGTVPGPFNSDPPTSGRHYPGTFDAGFYHESDLARLPEHPEGYIVHNLEHGYVIFWYNCALLDEESCSELKSDIQSVMQSFGNAKVIAFPWESLQEPVVMTSWGRMQRFENFDIREASRFVRNNRNKAPEPLAP